MYIYIYAYVSYTDLTAVNALRSFACLNSLPSWSDLQLFAALKLASKTKDADAAVAVSHSALITNSLMLSSCTPLKVSSKTSH